MTESFVDRIVNPTKLRITEFEQFSPARIYGKIGNLDLYASTCTLSHNDCEVLVDTKLIGPFPYRQGEIYYAYGSLKKREGKPVLKATILKNVDQLDLRLMDTILEARSAYFNSNLVRDE